MTRTPTGDACPACGSRQFRPLFRASDRLYGVTEKEFTVVECSGCRLIRLYPWPDPAELRTYYPEQYWFTPEASGPARMEEIYRRFVLRDHINFVRASLKRSSAGPVLDVGCGGALFSRMLRESEIPCVGLDFSLDAAKAALGVNRVPITVADFSRPPFAENAFAAVTMFHLLEHLYEPASYIEAAARCLKPDGALIVQVPNASCWQMLLFGEAWNGIDVPRHLVNFKAHDLQALLEHCGFQVTRQKFFSLRDNPAGLATTIAPGLDPMARRIRRAGETPRARLMKDLLYFALVAASAPFTILEAACRAGSTVMMEARRKV